MKNIKSRIENGVNKNLEDTIKQTRKFLSLVCHALVYIDGQVLSLRFHKGDGSIFTYDYLNKTNFRELLKLMTERGNNLDRQ